MGAIKFPHASGNSMSIAAPATNPASDLELKLPATIGTANQVLRNSSTPGTLEFGTITDTNDFKLLNTTTSSSTATTTVDGYFSSTYDTYKVIGYVSPDAADKFNIRLQTGGSTDGSGSAGSSYTTAHYVHASHRAYNDTSNNNQFGAANVNNTDYDNPGDVIRPGFGAGADDHQEEATNTGTYMLWLFCPLQTDQWTRYYSEFIFMAASNYNRHVQEGFLKTTTAVTGFNCWYDSNDHSGKFRLYGLK